MLERVASCCSIGLVISDSASSGLAPGYVVMTITYGVLIFGNRSGVILVRAITPNTMTMTTATNIVNGFLMLNFESIDSSCLSCADLTHPSGHFYFPSYCRNSHRLPLNTFISTYFFPSAMYFDFALNVYWQNVHSRPSGSFSERPGSLIQIG